MNDIPHDGKAKTPDSPTTIQSRVWIVSEVKDIRKLFLMHNARSVLPPDLAELADQLMSRGDGGWPQWVLIGMCVRFFRLWLERQLGLAAAPKKEPAPVNTQPAAPSESLQAAKPKSKR